MQGFYLYLSTTTKGFSCCVQISKITELLFMMPKLFFIIFAILFHNTYHQYLAYEISLHSNGKFAILYL